MLKSMDTLVALCKNRGFIYPGSEIYGGLANTWDYGPLGNELKNNVKAAWRKKIYTRTTKYCRIRCCNTYESRNMGCFWTCWRLFRPTN